MSVVVHNIVPRPVEALVDGQTFLIKCSGCDKPLVFVWANRPELDIDYNVLAECCYCEDKSFPLQIHGGFSIRGYDREIDSPENVRPIVNIVNMRHCGDNITIETQKV